MSFFTLFLFLKLPILIHSIQISLVLLGIFWFASIVVALAKISENACEQYKEEKLYWINFKKFIVKKVSIVLFLLIFLRVLIPTQTQVAVLIVLPKGLEYFEKNKELNELPDVLIKKTVNWIKDFNLDSNNINTIVEQMPTNNRQSEQLPEKTKE